MNKIILTLTIGSFLLYGCGNSTNEKSNNNRETATHQQHQHDDEQTIRLNNGEKWLVNEEMKPFILEAENILTEYINNNLSDYKTLAEQLKEKNSGLIKSCTMKGESHDELHKWLHPHLELIKALQNETDTTKASEIVLRLQHSYQQYHQYFN